MEYANLGRSGLSVSRICLGTMNFGWLTDEPSSFAIMDRALEEGVNFFDTANVYGGALGEGKFGVTESLLGRWLAQGGGRREKVVLATKVFQSLSDWPNDGRLSARHIRQACDESLRRLQTDHLDLYQMHHIDRAAPWAEVWEAMDLLRLQGKILYVGSSNFAGWHLVKAQERAERHAILGLVSEQSKYNLLNRAVELEVLPAAVDYGIGILPWSPLGGGMLGGYFQGKRGTRRSTDVLTLANLTGNEERLQAFEKLCADIGEDPPAIALAWLLTRPAVVAPVIGPRTLEQFDDSLRALDVTLEPSVLESLDEIFPGHAPAPEDYAW